MMKCNLETRHLCVLVLSHFAVLLMLLFSPTEDAYAQDRSVFGITLDKPLTIPDCETNPNGGSVLEGVKSMCAIRNQAHQKAWGTLEVNIYFPDNLKPDYVSGKIGRASCRER